jgi:hypothetical protein
MEYGVLKSTFGVNKVAFHRYREHENNVLLNSNKTPTKT